MLIYHGQTLSLLFHYQTQLPVLRILDSRGKVSGKIMSTQALGSVTYNLDTDEQGLGMAIKNL